MMNYIKSVVALELIMGLLCTQNFSLAGGLPVPERSQYVLPPLE